MTDMAKPLCAAFFQSIQEQEMPTINYPSSGVIDVHTHVFNANHLPIRGIMLRLMGVEDGESKRFRRWLAARLRDLVVGITKSSSGRDSLSALVRKGFDIGPAAELGSDELVEVLYLMIVQSIDHELRSASAGASSATASLAALESALQASPTTTAAAEVQWVFESSGNLDDDDELDAVISSIPQSAIVAKVTRRAAIASAAASPLGYNVITNAALNWLLDRIKKRMVDWLLDDGLDLVTFIHRMISSEEQNLHAILDSYAPKQSVNQIIHMQLDMESAYPGADDDPNYEPIEQWKRLQALSVAFPGKIAWFAGFDPRSHRSTDVVALCDSVVAHGARGFKFYPPMGYRAAENDDQAIESSCDAFFAYCASRNIPVFTHCSPKGFQARAESGLNGDPRYWERALQKQPALRLCFGHAGGGRQKNGALESHGWVAKGSTWDSTDNWARAVVELCRHFENVYCEFGHVDALIGENKKERAAFEANFSREFADAGGSYAFASKCMYGSDAVMPNMVRHTADFLEAFRRMFETSSLGQNAFDRFVFQNAATFLA